VLRRRCCHHDCCCADNVCDHDVDSGGHYDGAADHLRATHHDHDCGDDHD
jgi:hypothetical protein